MNNLTRFENDGIEIFIDPEGNSFASLNGVARIVGKPPKTIFQFKLLRNFVLQEAQVDTATGKKTVTLFNEDQILEVLEKYSSKRLKQFAKLGIKTALHQIAGYQRTIDPQSGFNFIVQDKLSMFDESDSRYQASIDKFFDESDPNFVEAIDRMTSMLVCTLYGELSEQLEKHLNSGGNPLDFYNWKQAKIDAEYVAKKFLREGRQACSSNKIGAAQKYIDQNLTKALDDLGINIP
jgi:hypothetical protein